MTAPSRPAWIWVIGIFYLLSAGLSLLTLTLVFSGASELTPGQAAYFGSMNTVDWLLSASIAITGLAGATALFLLRRIAVRLFIAALGLNVVATLYQMARTNVTQVLGGAGLLGVLLAWSVLGAVILYARSLANKDVLL
jgi:hypothetical protein